jgi:hypothetical protein
MLLGNTGSGYSHLTIHGYALSSHVGLAWASPWFDGTPGTSTGDRPIGFQMRWINAEKGVGQR